VVVTSDDEVPAAEPVDLADVLEEIGNGDVRKGGIDEVSVLIFEAELLGPTFVDIEKG